MKRPPTAKTKIAGAQLGSHIGAWRRLLGLTADQLAERAGISRSTLRRLESGEATVSLHTFLDVLRALGQLDRLVEAFDPYETDLGRARADEQLPIRVRRPS